MKNKGISHNSKGSSKTDVTSRVIRDSFFDIIRKSAEMTDIKMNDVNQYYDEKYQVKPGVEKENEATYKAVLYRELTESIDYRMITMESSAFSKKESVKGKKYDIWIAKDDIDYILEVKRFGIDLDNGDLLDVDNDKGIYGDLLKMDDLINTLIKNNQHTYGIAIGFFEGNDSITLDHIESEMKNKIRKLLDEEPNLKLLICANGKCKYVGE